MEGMGGGVTCEGVRWRVWEGVTCEGVRWRVCEVV